MSPDLPLAAAAQAGVFTRAQARADGWTDRQVTRRLSSGAWFRVAGSALAVAGWTIGPLQLAFSVHLTWPAAVISHELAGQLWDLPVDPAPFGTATAAINDGLRSPGLRVLRRPLTATDICRFGALRVTTRRRTAVDLLAALPAAKSWELWAWLVSRGVMTLADLAAEIPLRQGMTGTPQLRRLVRAGGDGALSPAEALLHAIMRGARISGWRANAKVLARGQLIGVVDVLFEIQRVVVEIDGWAYHRSREAFHRDRQRQNALVVAGYTVLRFTWEDLTLRPHAVSDQIRGALARA